MDIKNGCKVLDIGCEPSIDTIELAKMAKKQYMFTE
jgi:ubiquinone/menaquinone biosynthesis C-methylase UbiE